jgi:hypothetical protein
MQTLEMEHAEHQHEHKSSTGVRTLGITLLLCGIALFMTSKQLSYTGTTFSGRKAVNNDRRELIVFTADKLSLLGIGLLVASALNLTALREVSTCWRLKYPGYRRCRGDRGVTGKAVGVLRTHPGWQGSGVTSPTLAQWKWMTISGRLCDHHPCKHPTPHPPSKATGPRDWFLNRTPERSRRSGMTKSASKTPEESSPSGNAVPGRVSP